MACACLRDFVIIHIMASVPEEFLCPITLNIMKDPVVGSDGHTYERSAITQWLQKNPNSPLTRAPMTAASLKPNRALKNAIERYRSLSSQPAHAVPPVPSAPPLPPPPPPPPPHGDHYYAIQVFYSELNPPPPPPPQRPQSLPTSPTSTQSRKRKLLNACLCLFLLIILLIIILKFL